MRSVPIPGKILESSVAFGLSFDEIVVLASVPLVIMLPSLFVQQVPVLVSIGLALVVALGVVVVAVRTPEGQTPTEWAPAAFRRRFSPSTYRLRPSSLARDPVAYRDEVYTAEEIAAETTPESEGDGS